MIPPFLLQSSYKHMPKLLKEGDWGHSQFKSYLDLENSLNINNVPVTGAVSVLFLDKDHVVLTQHHSGGYDLVGGKIESGETYEDTLKREALEEAGVELTSWKYFGYYEIHQKDSAPLDFKNKYPKVSYILFFISYGRKVTEPLGEEIKGCDLFTIKELKEKKPLDHEMLWEAIGLSQ